MPRATRKKANGRENQPSVGENRRAQEVRKDNEGAKSPQRELGYGPKVYLKPMGARRLKVSWK